MSFSLVRSFASGSKGPMFRANIALSSARVNMNVNCSGGRSRRDTTGVTVGGLQASGAFRRFVSRLGGGGANRGATRGRFRGLPRRTMRGDKRRVTSARGEGTRADVRTIPTRGWFPGSVPVHFP